MPALDPARLRPMTDSSGPLPAGVRTYYLRRGRMSAEQKRQVRELLDAYGVPAGPVDPAALFPGRRVALEIGFGMGEATHAMAVADPDTGILAVDVHTPGVLRLLRLVHDEDLPNVRVAHEDAVALLAERLPPASLDEIRVYFPDPWPKARHHKRRLVQPAVVALLASRLRVGGVLHLATDVPQYAQVMREVTTAEPTLVAETADGSHCSRTSRAGSGQVMGGEGVTRASTRYETRGRARNHPVTDLVLRRR